MLAAGTSVRAQEMSAPAAGDFAVISQTINLSGLAFSAVIVFVAWALLKFVDGMVENIGRAHAERRLMLQRLNAVFHFFVYITTIALVILLSFKLLTLLTM